MIRDLSSTTSFQPGFFFFSLKGTTWSLPFLQCSYHAICYLASNDLSPSFSKNYIQGTSTYTMPLQPAAVSSRTDYLTRTATRGRWRCSSGPYMPGGRSTQVWSLSPPWRENKTWFSDSFNINMWLTYIVWILHYEEKDQSDHSMWFGFLVTCFHFCIELNAIIVKDPSLAAWKPHLSDHKWTGTGQIKTSFIYASCLIDFCYLL